MDNADDSIKICFPVLDYVNEIRYKHGIKFEEYGRFRKYCSKKLHILRRQLRSSTLKPGKYVHEEFPEVINDIRYLEILTIRIERAWSYAMDLKSKIEATSTRNKGRHHYMRRLGKAYRTVMRLEELSGKFGDNTTANNAKVYRKYIEGVFKFENERYECAHSLLSAYATVLDQKIRSTQGYLSEGYSSQLSQINSMLKLCTFHMRVAGKSVAHRPTVQEEDLNAELITIRTLEDGNISVYCRGVEIPVKSRLLLEKVLETLNSTNMFTIPDNLVTAMLNSDDITKTIADVASKINKQTMLDNYEEIMNQFTDCVNMIYSEIMTDINEQEPLRKLELFILLVKSLIEIEKHVVLEILTVHAMLNHDDASAPLPNCSEGVRYAVLLKQQISTFMEDANFGSMFSAPNEIVRTVNAFLLGVYNFRQEKLNEGMALIQWASKRRNITCPIPSNLQTRLLWRCLACFTNLSKITSIASDRYYKRTFAIFARNKLIQEQPSENSDSVLDMFDIEKRLIACKPLLFDLAFIHYTPPNIQTGTKFAKGVRNILASLWN